MEHKVDYELMAEQLCGLADIDPREMPLLCNASALLKEALPETNWAGFYLLDVDGGRLVLGPFQGKPACVHIALGKGVCGTAAAEDRTLLVEDVHKFPGHIACDSASASELVVPFHQDGRVIGVIDIDSPKPGRFGEDDRRGIENFACVLEEMLQLFYEV